MEAKDLKVNHIEDVMSKITVEMVMGLDYGDELKIDDLFTIQMHTECESVTLVLTEEWEEIASVLIEGDKVMLEPIESLEVWEELFKD